MKQDRNLSEMPASALRKICVSLGLGAVLFTAPVISGSIFNDGKTPLANIFMQQQVFAQEERRPPPPTRTSQTLSRQVSDRILLVMERIDEENFTEALRLMQEVRTMYDNQRLNDREAYTMWLFYANIAQLQDDMAGSLEYYDRILNMNTLTEEQLQDTIYRVGMIRYSLEQYAEAIDYLLEYLELLEQDPESNPPDPTLYLQIASAYFQIEQYQAAIPWVRTHMEVVRAEGRQVEYTPYSLLRAIYSFTEDYPNALQAVREMIVLFNEPDDWTYRASLLGAMERMDEQANSSWVNNVLGHLDNQSQLMNLAVNLYGKDYPYGAARVIKQGIDSGIIEENEESLSFLAQTYAAAREDEMALEPLIKAAELSEDGELYSRLATAYINLGRYTEAAEAFDNAFEKGGLRREDQTYLRQARVYLELNRHDEGIAAARAAGRDQRSREASETWVTYLEREKQVYESLQERRRQNADYFIR